MIRTLLSLATFAALLWSIAFVWFIQNLPDKPTSNHVETDAIIVLTGGNARIEHGFEVLAEGAAPRLFISGVGPHVTRAQMLERHATTEERVRIDELQPEIVLDYVADTTQTNAEQASAFVRAQQLRSIRLITASYHMPRSLLEFHNALPGIEIVADPVFPENFHRHEWWQHDATRRLVFSEFKKYFAALLLRSTT